MANNFIDQSRQKYLETRKHHWNTFARKIDHWQGWGKSYLHRLEEIYSFLINPESKVLEIVCRNGDLLASIQPTVGVGVDFSDEMKKRASNKHPKLILISADADDLALKDSKFDIKI